MAAINRFEEVIDNYQTTSHAVEALYRLAESYMMLGLPDEAKKYASVLGYNYPDSSMV
ncbi:tetratricopeptide repeat family protein [Rickettsia amblyommatis str. Darkwater]|nr:tetratricopeptide repeat family protein [Rickettsia amblyommatis str. Darkwater]